MSDRTLNKQFLPLLGSHFLSALNDSFVRSLFIFFIAYQMAISAPAVIIPAAIFFALTFCVGSTFAGSWADKISKKSFLLFARIAEIAVALVAWLASSWASVSLFLLIACIMGFLSACIRVANYSLIPELVAESRWVRANAWIKSITMLGASVAAASLSLVLKEDVAPDWVCLMALLLAIFSLGITALLPNQKAIDPTSPMVKNPLDVFDQLSKSLRFQYDKWAYIVGIAWFWVIAVLVLMLSGEYGQTILKARWSVVSFLSAGVFPVGYLIGSYLSVRLSKKKPLGSQVVAVGVLISLALFDFAFATRALATIQVDKAITVFKLLTQHGRYWRVIIDVFAFGVLFAMYSIPFYTLLQKATPRKVMGRTMSFSGLVNAVTVSGALLVALSLRLLGVSLVGVVVVFAFANLIVTAYMVRLLPVVSRRHLIRRVLTFLFRAKIEGMANLEKAGKRALIVTNHTSFMDVLLISAFIDKQIVFTISEQKMSKLVVKFMTSLVEVKPLDARSPMAVKTMVEELRQDKLCMIFPQGLVDGGNSRMKIYEGAAMMAMMGGAPIVPIKISGASYTFFSRVIGKRCERRLFPKIKLDILPAVPFQYPENMPNREKREKASSKLYDIITKMSFETYDLDRTTFDAVTDCMKMRGRFFPIIEDTARQPVKFMSMFLKAFVLGRLIRKAAPGDQVMGIMVPTSNTCALTVMGLHAMGKVPAMINFTSGTNAVVATCKTVGIETVITAHKVVSLAKLEPIVEALEKANVRILYLEDLKPTLTSWDKVMGVWSALFPKYVYRKVKNKMQITPDDTAVILFTSGSEGLPKAVFLTHKNILSNCLQVWSRFDVDKHDVLLNCLPMFHSFGLTIGMFLPLLWGLKTFLYPTPLHYRIIPEIAAGCHATIFFSTDTFLSGYARCANPYDFNTLRIVAGGAEKIKDETRKIWQEKFGVRLFEGYGATECAPIISVNTFLHQKNGSVGRLVPGIEYKLVPVEGIKEGGELWLKGPNVMKGYMRHSDPLKLDPPKDGWYDTGDIVDVDEDGFIFIKGRCKRFAKIGGEMVSLLAVEQVIAKEFPEAISGAVNIPDDKKGEQIVLITTDKSITKERLIELFKHVGMTELGLPTRIITTSEPPLLGTGKFDYVTAKAMALEEANKA